MSTSNQFDLSLVLACYNESEIFEDSVRKIISILDESGFKYELIFVEDCGEDNTRELIKIAAEKYRGKNISYIFNERNMGRGASVMNGFKLAKGEVIGYIDIDLEVPEHYIPLFVRPILRGDVEGTLAHRLYKFSLTRIHRWLASEIYSSLVKFLLSVPYNDTESGYKFFLRSKILPLFEKVEDTHWFWDTEIMTYCYLEGLRIKEFPTVFLRRGDKKSTVKFIRDSYKYFIKLLNFSRKIRKNENNNSYR